MQKVPSSNSTSLDSEDAAITPCISGISACAWYDRWGARKMRRHTSLYNAFMIFGGPSACLTARQRKKERREVFSVKVATPRYLDWSREAITFDRDGHPDYVPTPA